MTIQELYDCLKGLKDPDRLKRDHSEAHFVSLIKSHENEALQDFIVQNISITGETSEWFELYGILFAFLNIIQLDTVRFPQDVFEKIFLFSLLSVDHNDTRVASTSGLLLEKLVLKNSTFFLPCLQSLLKKCKASMNSIDEKSEKLFSKHFSNLEVILHSLSNVFKTESRNQHNLSSDFYEKIIGKKLMKILNKGHSHNNHFIRESSFDLLFSTIPYFASQPHLHQLSQISVILLSGVIDVQVLVKTKAFIATTEFLEEISSLEEFQEFHQTSLNLFLPAFCVNRHYPAHALSSQCQKVWKKLTKGSGKTIVELQIQLFIDHIIRILTIPSQAVNTESHLAAVRTLCDIFTIVDVDALNPHLPALYETISSFFDRYNDMFCRTTSNLLTCILDLLTIIASKTQNNRTCVAQSQFILILDSVFRILNSALSSDVRHQLAYQLSKVYDHATDDIRDLFLNKLNHSLSQLSNEASSQNFSLALDEIEIHDISLLLPQPIVSADGSFILLKEICSNHFEIFPQTRNAAINALKNLLGFFEAHIQKIVTKKSPNAHFLCGFVYNAAYCISSILSSSSRSIECKDISSENESMTQLTESVRFYFQSVTRFRCTCKSFTEAIKICSTFSNFSS